nr:ribonuclease H-like domain-containing protein [Tanacetum cinerariifolium]
MDDLYNNLKVYKAEIKGQSSSSSNSHNVAFVSSENTSSINEAVNTAQDIPAAGSKEQPFASSYVDDVAIITMRVKKFMKRKGRNLNFNGKETVGFDKIKFECYNFHRRGHFFRECHAPWNQGNRSADNKRKVVPVETPASALVVQDGLGGYDWSYQAEEGPTDFALVAHSSDSTNLSNFEVAMITIRVKRFIKKTWRNLNFNGNEPVGFDKTIVECYNYHIRGHFARECRTSRNQGNRGGDNERRIVLVETPASALVVQDGLGGYDWSYQAEEGPTNFALMAHSSDSANSSNYEVQSCLNECLQSFKNLQKQYDQKREILNKANLEILGASDRSVSEIDEDNNQAKYRNFVLTAVATKSGQVLVNAAKQTSAASTSTARPKVNTAAIRAILNAKSLYFKPHSTKRRHFNQKLAVKTNTFLRKINTAKGKNVTIVRPKALLNAAEGKKENVVKSPACWIWRQKGKLIDHTSKDSGSYTLKRFNYVDPNGRLTSDQGIFDSGCSRHITDFKLLDESQVLLKVPRQNNMYNSDLKNVVPTGDLTCLFTKATIDESNLWHKRLGHINFKTLNKLRRGNLVR